MCIGFKRKILPGGDVLKAVPKSGMSYSWRSILKGIDVLKKGIIWRVGNGESIRIWQDPWIPKQWTRLPMLPRGRNLVQKVEVLISPVTGGWDAQLVEQTFSEEDARLILALPIHIELDDCVAWHYDRKGILSVKSAYKVLMEEKRRHSVRGVQESSAGGNMQAEHWKGLWALKCPGKVRHFLWRLAHNSLAVHMNLKRRGMELHSRCVMCNRLTRTGPICF